MDYWKKVRTIGERLTMKHRKHAPVVANYTQLSGCEKQRTITRPCILAHHHILRNVFILMFLPVHCDHPVPPIYMFLALISLWSSLILYCSTNRSMQTVDLFCKHVKIHLFSLLLTISSS